MSRTTAQAQVASMQGATRSNAMVLPRNSTLGTHVSVQREASGVAVQPGAESLVREVVESPGRPLDATTRSLMEPRFGYDFSRVRAHTDERAATSAEAVRANAYTTGDHVVFGAGKYAPGTFGGQRLLAHELTHVVQQSTRRVAGTEFAPGFYVSDPADPFETEAAAHGGAAQRTRGRDRYRATGGVGSGATYLQRQQQPDPKLANAGAVAGIIGGIAGVAALGFAAFAYLKPPEALNPAPVTGGLTINPNPFSFNTWSQTPAMPQVTPIKEPPSHRAQFLQAQRGAPTVHPVIDLRTDDANHAVINLAERHDGINIVDASIRTGTMEKYLGGSRGSSATVNFSALQTPPAGGDGLFSAPESGTPTPQTAATTTPQNQAAATPAAPEPGEVTVSFTGSNAKDQGEPQNFAGSFTVSADGSVTVADPEVTNGVGRATKQANVAFIDYRAPVTSGSNSSVGEALSPSGRGGAGGILPRFDVPNPPILDRP
jgi:hypothetical protein